jgi:hypothetical protein
VVLQLTCVAQYAHLFFPPLRALRRSRGGSSI